MFHQHLICYFAYAHSIIVYVFSHMRFNIFIKIYRHFRICLIVKMINNSILTTPNVVKILFKLLDLNEPVYISKLLDVVSNQNRLKELLNSLEDVGLVELSDKDPVRRSRKVSLTEKGKRVAELLKQAEELINTKI